MTIPPAPQLPPEPPVREMAVGELAALVEGRNVYRAKALFELAARAAQDDAADALGHLSRLPVTRDDRLFHLVSLAWAAIIGLLAAGTPHARQVAYAAFADLDPRDRADLLDYLQVQRIEDAHPEPL
jgi:hypothetical protein